MLAALLLVAVHHVATPRLVSAQAGIRPAIPAGTYNELEGIGLDERLGQSVESNVVLRDHTGRMVRLSSFLNRGRPVVLSFVYHSCPNVCSEVLRGVAATLSQQEWSIGEQFDVLSISIDPGDTPEVAADARTRNLGRYARPSAEHGWHFLVGDDSAVRQIAESVGFRYRRDERTGQFGHPSVIMVLQPSGVVARYLYGTTYPPFDMRMSLVEAANGRTLSTTERFLRFCYTYNAHENGYVLVAWRVMRIGGAITAVALLTFLIVFFRRERNRRPSNLPQGPIGPRIPEGATT